MLRTLDAMTAAASQPDSSPAGGAPLTDTLYAQMRAIAGRMFAAERRGHTLQPTAVVNEACARILAHGLPDVPPEARLALASRVLRQVLIDHARAHDAEKRGGGALRVALDANVLAEHETFVDVEVIHNALERLRDLSERQAEVVTLKVFGGLPMDQIAASLGVSKRTVESDWTVARAWLRRELAPQIGLDA